MIDIIIPLYNAIETIEYTLMSINLQTIKNKIKVYLIDDASDDDYTKIINKYQELDIIYTKLEKNLGPGLARQKGLDISNSKYIIFMDADDLFYNADSVKILLENAEKYDLVYGITYDEKRCISLYNEGDLHGKLYNRNFIEKNKIKFNETRFHEDNYFNNLFLICDPKINFINNIVYIYTHNLQSITNIDESKEFERLEILLSNIKRILIEAKKRDCKREIVLKTLANKIKYFNRIWPQLSKKEQTLFIEWLKKYGLKIEKYINNNYDSIINEIYNTYEY